MTDLRPCATCLSNSQANLCHYTLQLRNFQFEFTFVRLRYSLGGDRPSQTTHHAGSDPWFHRVSLGIRSVQGGISRLPPQWLAPPLHRLPPILHKTLLIPLQSYSKGARGLSVWLLLFCICTKNSNSLDPSWRQWRSRYAIHAGRNLPDKEFRYLRTVRVTAAVYQGLSSRR